MTNARVVPKQTKKYKLTDSTKEADNKIGQIDQILIDQVIAEPERKNVSMFVCDSLKQLQVFPGPVNL